MASGRWIERRRHLRRVRELLSHHPAVGVLGARQVGKTTLARHLAEGWDEPTTRFDLEDPEDLARLEVPKLALADLEGLVILDEIQRRPELFPVLRVLVDRPGSTTRFLILGSASPDLLHGENTFPLADGVRAVSFGRLEEDLAALSRVR